MAFTIKKNTKIALKKETTEGTFEAATAADYIKAKADGLELVPAKETLTQDVLGSGLTEQKAQQGMESVLRCVGSWSGEFVTPVQYLMVDLFLSAENIIVVRRQTSQRSTHSTTQS